MFLRIGRSQSTRIQDLDRQMSSLITSTLILLREDLHSLLDHPLLLSFSKTPVYKPVLGKSKLDDHLLTHQKGSKIAIIVKRIPYSRTLF
jgi:hypothetical protein